MKQYSYQLIIPIFFILLLSATLVQAVPSITRIESGNLEHGTSMTISGTGFGTKSQAQPAIFDDLEDGSADTSATIGTWGSSHDLGISSAQKRHSNSNYAAFENFVSESWANFDGGPASPKLFIQYWFYLDPNFKFGSDINDNTGNLKIFRLANYGDFSQNMRVQLLASWDSDVVVEGIDQRSEPWHPVVSGYDWTNNVLGHATPGPTDYVDGGAIGWRDYTADIARGEWHLMQFEYQESDLDQYTGKLKWWYDGTLIFDRSDIRTRTSSKPGSMYPAVVGWYNSHGANADGADYFYLDEAYVDNSLARVELCTGSSFSNKGHCEIQIPNSWSTGNIAFDVNLGSFTPAEINNGLYLFVVDSNGAVSPAFSVDSEPITDPYITSINNNQLSHGSQYTISGLNFGTKSPVQPVIWDNFESAPGSVPLSGENPMIGSPWNVWAQHGGTPSYGSSNSRQNSNWHAYFYFPPNGQDYTQYLQTFSSSDEVFFSYWWRHNRVGNDWSANTKPWFEYGNYEGLYPAIYAGYNGGGESIGEMIIDCNPSGACGGGYQISGGIENVVSHDTTSLNEIENNWARQDIYARQSTAGVTDGELMMWTYKPWSEGLTLDLEGQNVNTRDYSAHRWNQWWILGAYHTNDDRSPNAEAEVRGDDIYFDITRARIELCDSSSWSLRSHCEIQIPMNGWNAAIDNTITFEANIGSFDSGTTYYLFVIDEFGVVSNAYPVSFSSSPVLCSDLAGASCSAGQGECESFGTLVCTNPSSTSEVPHCNAIAGTPITEDCSNSLDDDCDGVVNNGCPVSELIIDDGDTGTSFTGNWFLGGFSGGYDGDYLYSSPETTPGLTYTWSADNLVPGLYEVYAQWQSEPVNRPTDAFMTITHSSGSSVIPINQRNNNFVWVLLGTYDFDGTATVTLTSGSDGIWGTCADAIRFVRVNDTTTLAGDLDEDDDVDFDDLFLVSNLYQLVLVGRNFGQII